MGSIVSTLIFSSAFLNKSQKYLRDSATHILFQNEKLIAEQKIYIVVFVTFPSILLCLLRILEKYAVKLLRRFFYTFKKKSFDKSQQFFIFAKCSFGLENHGLNRN